MLDDKKKRIDNAGLKSEAKYVPCNLADESWVGKLFEKGFITSSVICFDFLSTDESKETKVNKTLANVICHTLKLSAFQEELKSRKKNVLKSSGSNR